MEIIDLFFTILSLIVSLIVDLWIFKSIINLKFNYIDKLFATLFILTEFIYAISINERAVNIGITIFEEVILTLYAIIYKKSNKRLVIGAILIFSVYDEINYLFTGILVNSISKKFSYFSGILNLLIDVILFLILKKYIPKLRQLIASQTGKIFIGILLYLYFVGIGIEFYIENDNRRTEVIVLSVALLVLQAIFAFILYFAMIRTEKNLLSKKEQEKQKLKYDLLNIKNQQLQAQRKQLTKEYNQLKEYAEYLDKNEDDLRKFKHDYQNMLNSLIISAENGKSNEVVKKLKQYTNSHINAKALRKYKGLNHVHNETIKSIAIAKLSKLYNSNLDYTFGCNKDIYHIPKSVNFLDLSRIIGIAFDNAYEESIALQQQSHNLNSAKIEAMYYQENDDFEFEIKNRVRSRAIDTDAISKKNYTTKKSHMGIGLANVMEIAHKYENTMLINYSVEDDWFIFDLVILPDEGDE